MPLMEIRLSKTLMVAHALGKMDIMEYAKNWANIYIFMS